MIDSAADLRVLAVTLGDVSGIGPEVVVRALTTERVRNACRHVVIGHPETLRQAVQLTDLAERCQIHEVRSAIPQRSDLLQIFSDTQHTGGIPLVCWNPADDDVLKADRGVVNPHAGQAAWEYLIAAIEMTRSGVSDAIVTAPLNKESLHLAGHEYPGHTEILGEQCGVEQFAMMLHLSEASISSARRLVTGCESTDRVRHGLSINHVTLHTSIASVPKLLTRQAVSGKIELMREFLVRLGCQRCAIGVCALNPHGGEHGLFGDEEPRIIRPAIEACMDGIGSVIGPLPVDTLVRRAFAGEFDGLVAMYHDQGHIPVKLVGFDSAVNITLGLPIVRTSPTHGTAFDRAWNKATPADASGMIEAILTAVQLCGEA